MLKHNVVEISDARTMWSEQDGSKFYLVHGRQPSLFSSNIEVVDFQGSGIINGVYVRSIDEAKKAFDNCTSTSDAIDIMVNARGSVCVHIFDHSTIEYFIMNDPLGGGQIYHYSDDSTDVFSSDLNSLRELCGAKGKHLKKDLKYFAAGVLVYTQSYGADSPYHNVRTVRRGNFLRFRRDGKWDVISALPPSELYLDQHTYNDGLERLRQDILGNVSISSKMEYDFKISHLTAGFDSRLILSALHNLDLSKEFLYYCIKTSPDWPVVKDLAGHLSLRMANTDGNLRGKGYQRNYIEYIKNQPRASQYALAEGLDSRLMPRKVLVYQGGYGEVGRTFNSFKWNGDISDPRELAYTLWRWNGYPSKEDRMKSMWSEDYLHHVEQRLVEMIKEFRALGLADDYFTNYLYVEGRNRIFIGARSYYASAFRSQFDPIYSRFLVTLTAQLDFERRRANFVGLDLMKSLSPEMLSYKFDSEKISPFYLKERGAIERIILNSSEPSETNIGLYSDYMIRWPGEEVEISADDVNVSQSLRIPEIVAFGIRKYGPRALEMISSDSDLQTIYNPIGLGDLKGFSTTLGRERALRLHSVVSSLILSDVII